MQIMNTSVNFTRKNSANPVKTIKTKQLNNLYKEFYGQHETQSATEISKKAFAYRPIMTTK